MWIVTRWWNVGNERTENENINLAGFKLSKVIIPAFSLLDYPMTLFFCKKSSCGGNRSARYAALLMPCITRFPQLLVLTAGLAFVTAPVVHAATSTSPKPEFVFRDKDGKAQSVPVEANYYPKKLTNPVARVDKSLNPKLMRAATIAQERANAHSRARCWQYVKEALLASGAVNSYPKTAYAKEAGQELVNSYGFRKLAVRDPFKAPVGSVIVYGASKAAGHVEIRTKEGFVSDFRSKVPSQRPLLGVYAKS
jgi:hypothetical protein